MMEVVLSRRNLESLLTKLDMPESAKAIVKGNGVVVRAVEDAEVYADRAPGQMHPHTERDIRWRRLKQKVETLSEAEQGEALEMFELYMRVHHS